MTDYKLSFTAKSTDRIDSVWQVRSGFEWTFFVWGGGGEEGGERWLGEGYVSGGGGANDHGPGLHTGEIKIS